MFLRIWIDHQIQIQIILPAYFLCPVKIRPFENLVHWGFQFGDKLMGWGDAECRFLHLQKDGAGLSGHRKEI